jgi:hypothetical protein
MSKTSSKKNTLDNGNDNCERIRAPYITPSLIDFGRVGPLTQAGSMGMLEGMGMSIGMPEMGP